MILEDYQKREDFFLKYDFEKEIMELSIEKLTKKKLKKISDMIRQEKRLNYDTLLLLNPTIAGLFQFILLMIKWLIFKIYLILINYLAMKICNL